MINTKSIRLVTIIVTISLVFSLISVMNTNEVQAATKKPAKVSGVKLSYNKTNTYNELPNGSKYISDQNGSIKITWKKAKRAKKYQVAYKKTTSKKWTYKTVKKRSLTITALANTKYNVKVRAVNGKKKGKWSKGYKSKKTWNNPIKSWAEYDMLDVEYVEKFITFFPGVLFECFNDYGYLVKDGVWKTYLDKNGIPQSIWVPAYFNNNEEADDWIFLHGVTNLREQLNLGANAGTVMHVTKKPLAECEYIKINKVVVDGYWQ